MRRGDATRPAGLMLAGALLALQAQPPAAGEIVPVRHGSEVAPGLVGPAAASLVPRERHGAAVIRDGTRHPFAREVAGSARYDGFTVDGPHMLIESIHFTGALDIYTARPIVIRGSVVRPERQSHWAIHTRPGAGRLHLLWSEAGAASAAGAPTDQRHAVGTALLLRAGGEVVYRSRLSLSIDGIRPSASGLQVIESLLDSLTYYNGAHNDGIQILGQVAGISILRSRVENPNPQTSAISILGRDVRVEGNHLSGGGWTVYGGGRGGPNGEPPATRVLMLDNVFGREHFARSGYFGAIAVWDSRAAAGNLWRDNRFSDGKPVPPR